ncbi:hypothetical protein JR316_0001301 [Psilocybe cubensis]|uniref:Uncharacterized protein n=2 Tax=Psilocybe cubensis TaxID=181762 RepID=A0ACB8HHN8_PSICU|nr:hypothetical protein JR316_0001301 [Psilocybe cubensis]KAH9487232.1 hypothetical protein JR316_0001301 [Psilocybe cubensis]
MPRDQGSCQLLPNEILELFVDQVGNLRSPVERRITLQACSLVSIAFRNRAHHHLFSNVEFTQPSYSVPSKLFYRLRKFREVVTSGLGFQMTSLLHHVQSFTLVMDGSVFDAYTTMNNEDLTTIIRMLCKHSTAIHTTTLLGSSMRIFWPYLTRDFREAFKELCRVPSMRTLHLENLCSVPATFLLGTKIKNIRLHLVTIFSPIPGLPAFNCLWDSVGQLQAVDIDHTFPFFIEEIIGSDTMRTRTVSLEKSAEKVNLSSIKLLRYTFHLPDDLQRFTQIALAIHSLEAVSVVFDDTDSSGFRRAIGDQIPLHELPALRTVAIGHKSSINTGIRGPLLKMLDVLKSLSVPRTLECIELSFEIHSHPPWFKLTEFFPETKTWALFDKLLTHETFDSVKRVRLNLRYTTLQAQPWTFDEQFFVQRCHGYLSEVFPLLMGSASKELMADVSVLPLGEELDMLVFTT